MTMNRRGFLGRLGIGAVATVAITNDKIANSTEPTKQNIPEGPVTYQDILNGNFKRYSKVLNHDEQKALIDDLTAHIDWSAVLQNQDQFENFCQFFLWLGEPIFCCEIFKQMGRSGHKAFTIAFYKYGNGAIQDKMVMMLTNPHAKKAIENKITVREAYRS